MASGQPLAFTVRAWSAWAEGLPADGTPAPLLLRRRVSTLGQHALRLAWNVACSGDARLIASSRHGEFRRALAILDSLVSGEVVSPAEFTLSVHHALVGLLSISHSNRRGHTAVAAGPESFCFGFLEAASCLAESPAEPVLLIHYDEPLPEPFDRFALDGTPALALVLALAADGPGEPMTLAATPTVTPTPTSPYAPAEDFCAFLADSEARHCTAVGARMTWQWSRHAAAG